MTSDFSCSKPVYCLHQIYTEIFNFFIKLNCFILCFLFLLAIKQLEQHKLVKQLQDEISKKDQELALFHSELKEAESVLVC